MRISLTLDNGPTAGVTPAALDALRVHCVKATFFMVAQGLEIEGGVEMARQVRDEGHVIGNHTWSHHLPLGLELDQRLAIEEVSRAQEALAGFADATKLYRPYAGKGILGPQMMSRSVYDYLKAEKYSCVIWNAVPRDWEPGWVDRAIEQITQREWSVVVVHDIERGGTQHLGEFLERAKILGAEFTTEFPRDCTPLWLGEEQYDFSANITEH